MGRKLTSGNLQVTAKDLVENKIIIIYFTFWKEDKRFSSLVCAKSRIVPKTQKITIPRLELMAALISARLLKTTMLFIPDEINHEIKCFSDSSIVLNWIKNENKVHERFVQNRVQEVRKLFPFKHWFHVNSKDNPADLATRMIPTKSWIDNDLWWKGPSINSTDNVTSSIEDDSEKTENQLHCLNIISHDQFIDFERFSSYGKLLETMKLVFKFCKVVQDPETILIKLAQMQSFSAEISCLKSKKPIMKQSSLY